MKYIICIAIISISLQGRTQFNHCDSLAFLLQFVPFDNEAITFNAAGVSQATLNNNRVATKKGSMNGMIQAYIMITDPLNTIQNDPFSATGLLLPDVDGTRNYINPSRASSYYNGHSMDNLLYEIEKNFQE